MPLGIISLVVWNLYVRASFFHPKFPLPDARLITAAASTNNLLNVSFAEPGNTLSALPAGLQPDTPHPHSCLDCVLCSGWVIPPGKESDVFFVLFFFHLNPALYRHTVKDRETASFKPTLQRCHCCGRNTVSEFWRGISTGNPGL